MACVLMVNRELGINFVRTNDPHVCLDEGYVSVEREWRSLRPKDKQTSESTMVIIKFIVIMKGCVE